MYLIKQVPGDFVVEEVIDLARDFPVRDDGPYLLLRVRKRLRNTDEVAALLAGALGIGRRDIGYAGLKDRNAITTQYFSVKGLRKERLASLSIPQVDIEPVGYVDGPLAIGLLEGNRFTITVRNLVGDEDLSVPPLVPNYFDEQRFSDRNARIGELIVRKGFVEAVALILRHDRQHGLVVGRHLDAHPRDAVGALRLLPRHVLRLYLHAFQSLLWNELLSAFVARRLSSSRLRRVAYSQGLLLFPPRVVSGKKIDFDMENISSLSLPLPGFGTEENGEHAQLIDGILAGRGLTRREFVIRQLPNLSLEGTERPAFMRVDGYAHTGFSDDELCPGKKRTVLSFTLGKASYATMLVKALFAEDDEDIDDGVTGDE